ncbi:hypothetical protein I5V12_00340 [Stenotrophomonas maltophilia]|uniref:hypothetical protein n=1 Tax=unclassified Stenotrophomonas TaxID=196198 RepID=UPI0018D4709C|nr:MULTISPECIES: hypothetical protein [unclassified Stenotrophomonas]MBH1736045.1 hypothetical protein [Stenotrophomonas maltophilia]WNB79890.1 hypothetical protein Q9R16_19120 [Stenotrophomonas sp. 9]
MRYSDDYLRESIPREDPPGALVPAVVREEIAGWIERDEITDRRLVSRSTKWTYALINELRLFQFRILNPYGPILQLFHPNLPPPRFMIGLFDGVVERNGFGFIAHVPAGSDWHLHGEIASWLEFPRLNARFPLIIREVRYDEHGPDHPCNATAASWARCNRTNRWGIITAGHAAPSARLGCRVSLESGSYGVLVRSYHPPIDAAFIQTSPPKEHVSKLPIRRFPASGQPVIAELKTGQQSRIVVHVDSFMQVVNTRQYPVQLFLDQPFQHGDSGALIRTSMHEAVGLYLGSVTSPAVPTASAGRVLNFEQAALALKVTPYL